MSSGLRSYAGLRFPASAAGRLNLALTAVNSLAEIVRSWDAILTRSERVENNRRRSEADDRAGAALCDAVMDHGHRMSDAALNRAVQAFLVQMAGCRRRELERMETLNL